jgi:hypothetical protein
MRGTMRRMARGAGAALLMAAALAGPARAQASALVGRVTDADGRPVAGAAVQVAAEGGGTALAARSERTGGFQAAGLAAGRYRLRVEAAGFAPTEQVVSLDPGERRTVVVRLRPHRASRQPQPARRP